jgi:four helix bundle protein
LAWYKNLLSYQLAELVFDITVLFCEKFVRISDRTNDQMVQSARSGFQNIAEGSVDSGVSKKSEIKLTGIAIGCMDELVKDYQKYLQKKKLDEWPPRHQALLDLKGRQVKSLDEFRRWVKEAWLNSQPDLVPFPPFSTNMAMVNFGLVFAMTARQLAWKLTKRPCAMSRRP